MPKCQKLVKYFLFCHTYVFSYNKHFSRNHIQNQLEIEISFWTVIWSRDLKTSKVSIPFWWIENLHIGLNSWKQTNFNLGINLDYVWCNSMLSRIMNAFNHYKGHPQLLYFVHYQIGRPLYIFVMRSSKMSLNSKKLKAHFSFSLYSSMSELYHAENPMIIEHTVPEI